MKNIFFWKKKNKIYEEDYKFLKAIILKLPSSYAYLIDQISEDFILGKKPNKLGAEGTFTLILNANLEKKFSSKSVPDFFIIKDIMIWNREKNKFEDIELDIMEGMLAGFKVASNYRDLDYGKIDVSKIKEKHFKNEDKENLKSILGKVNEDVRLKLDIEGTFKIEIPEGEFYVIKDLEDGNYIAIDGEGAVYGMIHDPYEIEKIFNNKDEFFESLANGKFSFADYYNKKLS